MNSRGALTVILLLWIFYSVIAQVDASQLFLKACYEEEVNGDLQAAIAIYEKIIERYRSNRKVVAKAVLKMALCFEQLGDKKAEDLYRKILRDYKEQTEAVLVARSRLTFLKTQTRKINPLVKYYFERVGIDPLTHISFDRKYIAFTDWTTGNLVIRNLHSGKEINLTHKTWQTSPEYAVQPIWSRDGKYLAFGWFKEPSYIELRVVSLKDKKVQVVYSNPRLYIYPQDWHPSGKEILCEAHDFSRNPPNRMVLISLPDGKMKEIIPTSYSSRGYIFSPDGAYICYDLLREGGRRIMIYSFKDSTARRVSDINIGEYGFDNPVWNASGDLVIYRSRRLGKFDLWATPVENGRPNGASFLVQSDISQYLFYMKGMKENNFQTESIKSKIMNQSAPEAFIEEFSNVSLNPDWFVYIWREANIYDYDSFGRYSLKENPGHLRYYLSPATYPASGRGYIPHFANSYWHYPAMEMSRPFSGDRWKLETKCSYYFANGANTRRIILDVHFFSRKNNDERVLRIMRDSGFPEGQSLGVKFYSLDREIVKNDSCLSPADTNRTRPFTYYFRIIRDREILQVRQSEDGRRFRTVLTTTMDESFRGCMQMLRLSSGCWFVPANTYADWDYFRLTPIK
ncbi:MAG TPA: hypothetical protein ENK44_16740 [Caldithrix abyssi]|uniref:Tetratricopeptide repeat protein n=1 Tax=Caldithrix abyssi TaxID=187145 RepID=A0A7V4U457_CALAY|nr:hypothetical protein [Caldithrix abyssi]